MPITEGFTAISLRVPDDLKLWLEGEAEKDFSSVNRIIWVILERERERKNGLRPIVQTNDNLEA